MLRIGIQRFVFGERGTALFKVHLLIGAVFVIGTQRQIDRAALSAFA